MGLPKRRQKTANGGSKISYFFFLHSCHCFVDLKRGESFETPKHIGCFVFLYESTLILMIFEFLGLALLDVFYTWILNSGSLS